MAKYLLINSLGGGGAERQAILLATMGVFDGIIVLENDRAYPTPSVPVYSISPHANRTSRMIKFFTLPLYVWRIASIIKNDDIVVSFLERSNMINVVVRLIRRHRAIISERQSPSLAYCGKRFRDRVQRMFIRALYPRADSIVVNSHGIRHDLTELFFIS